MVELTPEELRKLQMVELEMLIEFDRICRKYDIPYSIDGGTLLGAVRHKGFIPWDDDADVIMNRPAYERFLKVVDNELDDERFYFQDIFRTKGYRWGYSKIRRKGTTFIRKNQDMFPYEQGVFLDIFVCDNVPDFYPARCICNFTSFVYRKLFYSVVGERANTGLLHYIYHIMTLVPEESLKKSYKRFVERRKKSKPGKWTKCLLFPARNKDYGFLRSWYEDLTELEFEGRTFKASRDYKNYLAFMYGPNYMTPPPLEKRRINSVKELAISI